MRRGARLLKAAQALERGGAKFLVLCTNTMHKVAGAITASLSIPLLHIADPTADVIIKAGVRRVGLLGTRFTMGQRFFAGGSRLIGCRLSSLQRGIANS